MANFQWKAFLHVDRWSHVFGCVAREVMFRITGTDFDSMKWQTFAQSTPSLNSDAACLQCDG